jgi:hypothetical protein
LRTNAGYYPQNLLKNRTRLETLKKRRRRRKKQTFRRPIEKYERRHVRKTKKNEEIGCYHFAFKEIVGV